MASACPKRYRQSFRENYSVEFPCILRSSLGNNDAHCKICLCDFSISHGGKTDIMRHINSVKHKKKWESSVENKKLDSFFRPSGSDTNTVVMRAECMFTSFLIEHNIPMSAADHVGKLFKKMFPDSNIAKNYSCGRTKSSAILNEMAIEKQLLLISHLKNTAFSIGIDGSNDSDSKLHPIVVSYFDEHVAKIQSCVLAFTNIIGGCSGINIAKGILDKFEDLNIPFDKCMSFGADNAPVMLGPKNGVQKYLKEHQKELIVIGCPCHLLNLAAHKATSVIDFSVDQAVIDIFYYLEFSANRKEKLKMFQELHSVEVRKILKHASTRWLSLGRCLQRILEQWEPLVSFFLSEIKKEKLPLNLELYKIPKLSDCFSDNSSNNVSHEGQSGALAAKRKTINQLPSNPKKKKDSASSSEPSSHFLKRDEKIFYFLSSDLNKAYCAFILFSNSELEKTNIFLQTGSPLIHCLKQTLNDCLRNILLCFINASCIKAFEMTKVPYYDRKVQKKDDDLRIGNRAMSIVNTLSTDEKKIFYSQVRKYYVAVCDYITKKFPLNTEVLENAEVADLAKISSKSFNSVRYFVSKFPFLLFREEGESEDEAWDKLENEFNNLQLENLNASKGTMDKQISSLNDIHSVEGIPKYRRISKVLLAILTIPHSNAECERVFSLVKKNRNQFRSSMSNDTLEKLLIVKCKESKPCYETEYSKSFILKAKSATTVWAGKRT